MAMGTISQHARSKLLAAQWSPSVIRDGSSGAGPSRRSGFFDQVTSNAISFLVESYAREAVEA